MTMICFSLFVVQDHCDVVVVIFLDNDGLFQIDETMICWDINGTYSGYISRTRSNRRCQPWASLTPHAHNFTHSNLFPADGTVENASDYCRDPYGISKPWCFTKDIKKRWEFCRVPICNSKLSYGLYVLVES